MKPGDKFQFELSGNITNGKKGSLYNFDELVALITEEIIINEDIVLINKNLIVSEGNLLINENVFSWNTVSPETLGIESSEVKELFVPKSSKINLFSNFFTKNFVKTYIFANILSLILYKEIK